MRFVIQRLEWALNSENGAGMAIKWGLKSFNPSALVDGMWFQRRGPQPRWREQRGWKNHKNSIKPSETAALCKDGS